MFAGRADAYDGIPALGAKACSLGVDKLAVGAERLVDIQHCAAELAMDMLVIAQISYRSATIGAFNLVQLHWLPSIAERVPGLEHAIDKVVHLDSLYCLVMLADRLQDRARIKLGAKDNDAELFVFYHGEQIIHL